MLPSEIRRVARERALLEVEKQKKDFMSWGVMGDWDKPYLTLSKFRRHTTIAIAKSLLSKPSQFNIIII